MATGHLFAWENNHSLAVTLDKNVSPTFGPSDIAIENLTTGGVVADSRKTVSSSGNTHTTTISPILDDGNYESNVINDGIAATDGSTLASDHHLDFFVLGADANHDRVVNQTDQNILFANYGATGVGFSGGDFDHSGQVNMLDFNILAGRFGATLETVSALQGEISVFAPSASQIWLGWAKQSAVDGYRVYQSTDGVSFTQIGQVPQPTTRTVDFQSFGLTDGTKYWYRVRPYTNAAGNGPSYERKWAVTTLPAPTNLTVSDVTDDQVALNWQDNSTTESGFTIQRSINGGAFENFATVGPNITTYTPTGLNENTNYSWRVVAGNSVAISAASVSQAAVTKLNAPTDVRMREDSIRGSTLHWQDESSQESQYEVNWTNPDDSTGSITTKANGLAILLPVTVSANATIEVKATSTTNASAGVSPAKRSEYAYTDDFDAASQGYAGASWSGGDTQSYTSVTYGNGEDHFKGLFTDSATLTLSALPTHAQISYGFQIIYIPDPANPNDDPEFTVQLGGETVTPSLAGFSGYDVHSPAFSSTRGSYILATSNQNELARNIPHHGESATLTIACTGNAAGAKWGVFGIAVATDTSIVKIEPLFGDDYSKEGAAAGSDHEKATLKLQRIGNRTLPLTVPLNVLAGSTDAGQYSGLPQSVTFPAGEAYAYAEVQAVNDSTPEWTQKLITGIEADPALFLTQAGEDHAKVELVDDDLDVLLKGLDEEDEDPLNNETNPGAFIPVNDDDDNENGNPDNQDEFDVADDDLELVEVIYPSGTTELQSFLSISDVFAFRVFAENDQQVLGLFPDGSTVSSWRLPTGRTNVTLTFDCISPSIGDFQVTTQGDFRPQSDTVHVTGVKAVIQSRFPPYAGLPSVDNLLGAWPDGPGVAIGDNVPLNVQILPAGIALPNGWNWSVSNATATGVANNAPEIVLQKDRSGTANVTVTFPDLGTTKVVWIEFPDVGTQAEAAVAVLDPVAAATVLALSNRADDYEASLMANGVDAARANAMKHAYWNALITYFLDSSQAALFTTAHEFSNRFNGGLAYDTVADLHNNAVGRSIASSVPTGVAWDPWIMGEISAAAADGRLWIIDPYSVMVIKSNDRKIYGD